MVSSAIAVFFFVDDDALVTHPAKPLILVGCGSVLVRLWRRAGKKNRSFWLFDARTGRVFKRE